MQGDEKLVDGAIALRLDVRTYRLVAIKKAAYRLADRFTAVIGTVDADFVDVTLRFRPATTEATAREGTRAFYQELLDQELREHVAEETGQIRTLILAQAFSRTGLFDNE